MKLTLGHIKNAEPALKKLLNADLPVVTAFKFSKLVKRIGDELTHWEECRKKVVMALGEPDEQKNVKVPPEKLEAFADEMNKLNAVEIELSFVPVAISELGDIKMTAVEMMTLSDFVK